MCSVMTLQFDSIWFKNADVKPRSKHNPDNHQSRLFLLSGHHQHARPVFWPVLLLYLWRDLCLCPNRRSPLTWIKMLPQQACLWATLASLPRLWACDVTHLESKETIQNSLKGKCMCPTNKQLAWGTNKNVFYLPQHFSNSLPCSSCGTL